MQTAGISMIEAMIVFSSTILICLAAAALLGLFPGMSGMVTAEESSEYWASATPIGISAYSLGREGFSMELKNNSGENIVIKEFRVGDVAVRPENLRVPQGGTAAITSQSGVCKNPGETIGAWVGIIYREDHATQLQSQVGEKPLVAKCA